MPTSRVAALTAISLILGTGIAAASESPPRPASSLSACSTASTDAFMPEADLRAVVERLGYRVTRIKTDSACYEVLAADRSGKFYEVKFKGADLRMISRYEVKGEQ